MAVCGKCIHKNVCEFCKEMGFQNVVRANDFNCKDYLPEADVVEVKHGRWISNEFGNVFICSECGRRELTNIEPYCHCGAKMDGGKE